MDCIKNKDEVFYGWLYKTPVLAIRFIPRLIPINIHALTLWEYASYLGCVLKRMRQIGIEGMSLHGQTTRLSHSRQNQSDFLLHF